MKKFKTKDELEQYFFGCGDLQSSPLVEEIFSKCLEEGFVINSFYLIKSIPLDSRLRKYPEFFDFTFSGKIKENEQKEVFPNLVMQKGILYNILDSLGLEKTKKWLIMYNIIKEEELNQNLYYSSEELKNFCNDDFENILFQELNEKQGHENFLIKILW